MLKHKHNLPPQADQPRAEKIKQIIKLGVFLILSVFAFLSYSYFTRAQVPDFVNYQGRLMDGSGTPITSATTIQFSLYSHPTNGSPGDTPSSAGPLLWTETYDGSNPNCQQITPGADGIFAQHLGDCISFPSYLDFTQEYYLGVKIGSDNEATPRVPLSTHPYAFTSKRLYAENEDVYITTGTSGNIVIQPANDVLLYDTNASVGVAGEILSSTGNGIDWISPSSFAAGSLWDTDHDTGVQVEENADDDTLRIDTAGSQRMAIDNTGNLLLSDTEPISFINPGNLQGLLFRDDKFALRIGETNNNEWDDANVGRGSFASGRNNIVSGNYSVAFGGSNNINDVYATALGRNNTVTGSYAVAGGYQNVAGGYASSVFGQTNQVTDRRAMAWGLDNIASQDEATAWGRNTRASANYATSWGRDTQASGNYSTAFGYQNTASQDYGLAFGYQNTVSGRYATGWGGQNTVSGQYGTAWGSHNTASGAHSTAFGYYSEASGENATAIGDSLANSNYMTAIGRFNENVSGQSLTNWVDTDQLFVIGNGTGWQNANRSNALTVLKNGTITAPSFSLAEIDAAGDTALTTKEYVDNQLMWEILATGTGGMRIQPKDHSVRQIYVEENSNSYTQFMVRNNNDTGNGAGAIIELKGSGADYTNNMYIGKYGAGFWIPELQNQGAVLTDRNLVIGTASAAQEIHFVTGNSYSDLRPVVVADNEGFRYTSDLSVTFADRTLVDKEYVDNAIVNSVNSIYVLDGTLTGDRVLNADDNDLTFMRLNGFTVLADDGTTNNSSTKSRYWQTEDGLYLGIEQKDTNQITYLDIRNNDFTIGSTHANFRGATYAGDYSADFVDNSLVTKKYVDDNIGVLTWTPGSSGIHSAQTIGNETTGGDAVGDYSVVGGNNSFAGGNSSVAFGENATAGYAPNVTDDPNGLKPITSLTDDMFNISNSDLYAGATHVELYYDAGGGTYTPYITTAITWIDDQFNGTSNVTVADDYSAHTPVRALFKIVGAPNTFDNAFALGKGVLAGNNGAFAFGEDATASGQNSMAIGFGSTASSYGEIALGIYNTSYSPNDTVNFDSNDRLLVIGNGVDDSNRSDAFVMYKNGLSTFNNITSYGADYSANYTNRSLVDKAYVDSHIGTSIFDADIDTGIQVEANPDEDMVRFSTAGTERFLIDNNGRMRLADNPTSFGRSALFEVGIGSESSTFAVSGDPAYLNIATFRDEDGENIFRAQGSLANDDLIVTFGDWDWAYDQLAFGLDAGDDALKLYGGAMRFYELGGAHADYIGFKAPNDVTTNTIWTLPGSDGTNGQVLQTDGSGNLSWTSLSGGSGVTASNGLTKTGNDIRLGGALTQNTTVGSDTDNSYLIFRNYQNNIAFFSHKDSTNYSYLSIHSGAADFPHIAFRTYNNGDKYEILADSSLGGIITDDINHRGLQYYEDYSANYTDRTLVDKEYVDNVVASGSSPWTKTGTNLSPTTAGDDILLNAGETLSISDLTQGSIPFIGAGGLVTQDNANLFWDDANDRLGLGTTTPVSKLDIEQGNIELDKTTHANQFGVINKNNGAFLHDFNYGNNGTVTTVGYNTFLGINAGNFTMGSTAGASYEGSYNTGIGDSVMTDMSTGHHNTALGTLALRHNTTGNHNTALGLNSLSADTIGLRNTGVGSGSLQGIIDGNRNVAIGNDAGRFIQDGVTANTTGDNSLFLGTFTKALADNDQNEIVIGYNATGIGSNSVVLGNDSIVTTALKGDVGIGTTTPNSLLDVVGGNIQTNRALVSRGTGTGGENAHLVVDAQASTLHRLVEFRNNNGNQFTVMGNNRVGIGVNNPNAPLHIRNTQSNTGAVMILQNTNGDYSSVFETATNPEGNIIGFRGDLAIDGLNGNIYIKNDNDNTNTGWVRLLEEGDLVDLWDTDFDTGIQVEESADEDMIRFDTAGSQRMRIDNNGLLSYGTEKTDYNLAYFGTQHSVFTVVQEPTAMATFAGIKYGDDAEPGRIAFLKARGSEGAETALQDGDEIAEFATSAYDGTRYMTTGGLIVKVDGVVGTDNVPSKLEFLTNTGNNLGSDVKMVLDHNGNLGIGDSVVPTSKLHVDTDSASTEAIMTLENVSGFTQIFRTGGTPEGAVPGSVGDIAFDGTNGEMYIKHSGNATTTGWLRALRQGDMISLWDADSDTGIQVEESADEDIIRFDIGDASGTAHQDAMVINSDGNVGIGTTSPSVKLQVSGQARASSFRSANGTAGSPSYRFDGDTNTGLFRAAADNLAFTTGGSEAMRIDANGNLGLGVTIPTYKMTIAGGALMLDSIATIPTASQGYAGIYTSNGELYAFDESANSTQISPHDKNGKWWYNSTNLQTGNTLQIKMEDLTKDLNKLLGGGYILENGVLVDKGQNVIEDLQQTVLTDKEVINDFRNILKNIDVDELENRIDNNENLIGEINNSIKNIIDEIKQLWGKVTKNSDDIEDLKKENDELKKELCKENNDYSWCDDKEDSEDESSNEEEQENQQPTTDEADENTSDIEIDNNNSETTEETTTEEQSTEVDNEQATENQNDNNESSDNVAGN